MKKNFKDELIDRLRAENDQFRARINKLERSELDCFVLLLQANIPLYVNGNDFMGPALSLPERVKLLKEKAESK